LHANISNDVVLINWFKDDILIKSLNLTNSTSDSIWIKEAGNYKVKTNNFDSCSTTSAPVEVISGTGFSISGL